jgi:hypothetical protein
MDAQMPKSTLAPLVARHTLRLSGAYCPVSRQLRPG